MSKRMLVFALVTLALLYGSNIAQANLVTGNLWHVPEATAGNAIPANVPGSTPDVTFDVNSPLNFSATNATVGAWLSSGSAFNITENTAGTLSSLMDNFTTGTLVEFTGLVTVTNGMTFTVTHDDGLTLIIGGVNLGFNPGPTAPVTSTATYTGPSGNQPFTLVYGEVSGGPAVLQVDLPFSNVNVPLPSTWLLFGSGLAGLSAYGLRRGKV
jgi:hypothetical protein